MVFLTVIRITQVGMRGQTRLGNIKRSIIKELKSHKRSGSFVFAGSEILPYNTSPLLKSTKKYGQAKSYLTKTNVSKVK